MVSGARSAVVTGSNSQELEVPRYEFKHCYGANENWKKKNQSESNIVMVQMKTEKKRTNHREA